MAGCGFLVSSAEADMLAMMARCSRPQSIQATLHIHLYPKSWTGKLTGAAEILVLMPMAPDELGKFIAADTEKWAKVVKFAGIKLQ